MGVLLQPAAVPTLTPEPEKTRDQTIFLLAEGALASVAEAVAARGLEAAAGEAESWLVSQVGDITDEMRLANQMAHLLQTDTEIDSVPKAAAALGVSQRTLHRLAKRYVGLTPYSMIRRRRIQNAVRDLRDSPEQVSGEAAGAHTDQSHLTREMRDTLGITPGEYQRSLREPPGEQA